MTRPPLLLRALVLLGIAACASAAISCGSTTATPAAATGGPNDGSASQLDAGSTPPAPPATPEDAGALEGGDEDVAQPPPRPDAAPPQVVTGTCNDPPPEGFVYPTMPVYAGTCPTLAQAPTENTIVSSGNSRQFLFVSPPDMKPNEKLPLVFTWHWLKGSGQDFIDKADVVSAVQQQRFIAVSPESKGDLLWDWPFAISDTPARMAEEVQFFMDMLACVTQQVPQVNTACISSAGVSAGALFTSQLGPAHSDLFASMIVLSGGVSGGFVQPMPAPKRALPSIVLWGGPTDKCAVIDFGVTTADLENALDQVGGYFVECEHNCGHSQPPFSPPAGMTEYAAFWDFIYEHPMWTTPGASPYKKNGLPTSFPSWCSAAGKGTAVERTGACGPPACTGI
jgi:hypothetical protein